RALPARKGRVARIVLGPIDVWRTLRVTKPRLIHVHDPELIPLAILWRLGRGRSAVYDAHEDLPKQVMGKGYIPPAARTFVARIARALEVSADKHLDTIVAATPSIARNYERAPVVLVQNFPWLREFPELAGPASGTSRKFVYVGGIADQRGCLEMMRAAAESTSQAELVLAGPASESMMQAIQSQAGNRIAYLGNLPADEVPQVLAGSLAGLVLFHPLANNLESQPTKLFEYMAAGLPFIASDFPAWRELLGEFDCGFFVDPLDVQAIRDTLDLVVADPASAREMGRRGRKAFETAFTFEVEAARLVAATTKLLSPAN
ncbi:MAG: hypothetical protein QOE58_1957, partial [Actinomycetota bacterium]|nr:hypothetical protein [Actinomycetota bacterium]